MLTVRIPPVRVDPPAPRAPACPPSVQRLGAGEGRVEVRRVGGASAVTTLAAAAPLRLFAPRARAEAAWLVAASLGGGLVAGDAVALDLEVGPGAAAALATQAETKVYRPAAAGRGAAQRLRARVGAGGVLALLPDPVSPYAGAVYRQDQRVALAAGASLLVLDAVTAGRAARGEAWALSRYSARLEVEVAGRLVLADAVHLDAAEGPPLAERLRDVELLATVVALGPAFAAGAAALLADVAGAEPDRAGPVLESASPLPGGALLRLAARSVEAGLARVRARLAFAAPALGGDLLLRRP